MGHHNQGRPLQLAQVALQGWGRGQGCGRAWGRSGSEAENERAPETNERQRVRQGRRGAAGFAMPRRPCLCSKPAYAGATAAKKASQAAHLQPHDAGQVQVVGGLIQQQQIRLQEQRLGQRHADAPAACASTEEGGEVGRRRGGLGQPLLRRVGRSGWQTGGTRRSTAAAGPASATCHLTSPPWRTRQPSQGPLLLGLGEAEPSEDGAGLRLRFLRLPKGQAIKQIIQQVLSERSWGRIN